MLGDAEAVPCQPSAKGRQEQMHSSSQVVVHASRLASLHVLALCIQSVDIK